MSISYTGKTGSVYVHDQAVKLYSLLLDMALLLGLLKKQGIDVDFDNELVPAEKSDGIRKTYKVSKLNNDSIREIIRKIAQGHNYTEGNLYNKLLFWDYTRTLVWQ